MDIRNVLFMGAIPVQAPGPPNRLAAAADFVNAGGHDYRLALGSGAIDSGEAIAEVTIDRIGVIRPQGQAYDIGAYERSGGSPPPPSNTAPTVSVSSPANGASFPAGTSLSLIAS